MQSRSRDARDARDTTTSDAALFDRVVDHVLDVGIAGLSLRPLGAAVGASPRTLLYHFTSKEALLARVVERVRELHVELYETWADRSGERSGAALLVGLWQWVSAPRHDRLVRLGIEAHALAIRDRRRHGVVARGLVQAGIPAIVRRLERDGFDTERAVALATLLAATMRGLHAVLLAGGERAPVDRAFRSFVAAVEAPRRSDS